MKLTKIAEEIFKEAQLKTSKFQRSFRKVRKATPAISSKAQKDTAKKDDPHKHKQVKTASIKKNVAEDKVVKPKVDKLKGPNKKIKPVAKKK